MQRVTFFKQLVTSSLNSCMLNIRLKCNIVETSSLRIEGVAMIDLRVVSKNYILTCDKPVEQLQYKD